jgi:hypothetical protein
MNTYREKILARAVERSRYDSEAEVIEQALTHFVESVETVEDDDLAQSLTPEQARLISTSEVKLILQPRREH